MAMALPICIVYIHKYRVKIVHKTLLSNNYTKRAFKLIIYWIYYEVYVFIRGECEIEYMDEREMCMRIGDGDRESARAKQREKRSTNWQIQELLSYA